jgi:hypothetical protein
MICFRKNNSFGIHLALLVIKRTICLSFPDDPSIPLRFPIGNGFNATPESIAALQQLEQQW